MYKHKSRAAKRKKKAELDVKNAKNPKITNVFSSPKMIYPETVFCVLICGLKLYLVVVALNCLLLVNLMLILIS
jgi:hypothetical protein